MITFKCNDCGKDADMRDIMYLYTETDEGAYCKACIQESHQDILQKQAWLRYCRELNKWTDELNKALDKADARFK